MDNTDLNTGCMSMETLPLIPKAVHENELLKNLKSDELGIGGDLSLSVFSHFVKVGEESHFLIPWKRFPHPFCSWLHQHATWKGKTRENSYKR